MYDIKYRLKSEESFQRSCTRFKDKSLLKRLCTADFKCGRVPLADKERSDSPSATITEEKVLAGSKLQTKTVADFRNRRNLLVTQKFAFHTYSLKEEREIRVVLRGVPREIPVDEVKEGSQNLPVQSVRRVPNRFRQPLDLVLVSGTAEANDKAMKAAFFKIRSVCSLSDVKEEQPRKRALPGLCHNCQSYGHSSRHCFNPARCVKCQGNHGTA
ncbi:Nucleic-acid-binding protein from transposon X-element [Eumeta japonica]|uniref:Nucleic-acid-binding protein from transposon X-element n=1 Tax=Eumeta variegata TaxID=151549 RepID=A0A4C1VZU5_EUMVA|nr:Nucleic-acid-binding protein from transposon X-element [Eumeta japonica]